MPTAFSENEKELIRRKLHDSARECLGRYGVRKTTVEEIARMAGISKGGFYLFYPSKEILFFTVFEAYQKELMNEALSKLRARKPGGKLGAGEFTDLIFEIYHKVRNSFFMNMIRNNDYEYVLRKIPEEYITQHHSFDDIVLKSLLSYANIKENVEHDLVAASLRAVFTSLLHVKEIGEKEFDRVLKLLIRGLAQQVIEEVRVHD